MTEDDGKTMDVDSEEKPDEPSIDKAKLRRETAMLTTDLKDVCKEMFGKEADEDIRPCMHFQCGCWYLHQAEMPKQIRQTLMAVMASQLQIFCLCATLQNNGLFFCKQDLGGPRLRWAGLGRLSLGPGLGDQIRDRPSPEWSRNGSSRQDEFPWTQIETKLRFN